MDPHYEDDEGFVHRLRRGWGSFAACWAQVRVTSIEYLMKQVNKPVSCLECLATTDEVDGRLE